MSRFPKLALLASPGEPARKAERQLREIHEFVPIEEADAVIALGGDGFLLQLLHRLLEQRRGVPASTDRTRRWPRTFRRCPGRSELAVAAVSR